MLLLSLVVFSWLTLWCGVVSEPVLRLSDSEFLVSHSSAALSFSLTGLLGPVVSSEFLVWESTR